MRHSQLAGFTEAMNPDDEMSTRAITAPAYSGLLDTLGRLVGESRAAAARSVNAVMTATYWKMGRHVVDFEQHGAKRASYGEALLRRLAVDLTARHGRGFSERNLEQMRQFYLCWPISQTLSAKSSPQIPQTTSAEFAEVDMEADGATPAFPLSWSHYVRLIGVKDKTARRFYEAEALRGGWSVRQLDRQIGSLFFERTALSKNKVAMLAKGAKSRPEDRMTADDQVKDPLVLEFLKLKDEYSESDLEEALLSHLESFLLELGGDFAFVREFRGKTVQSAGAAQPKDAPAHRASGKRRFGYLIDGVIGTRSTMSTVS